MKRIIVLLSFISFSLAASAQTPTDKNTKMPRPTLVKKAGGDRRIKGYGGIGLGLDHGGIGAKFEYLPLKSVGVFAGLGVNLAGLGFNVGANYKFLADSDIRPIVSAMYGYNAVMIVKFNNTIVEKKTYYGPTFGGGAEFDMGRRRTNKLTAQLLIPIRSQEFIDDAEAYDADYFPFAISVGYHWGF